MFDERHGDGVNVLAPLAPVFLPILTSAGFDG
jgi:hypothetical protein